MLSKVIIVYLFYFVLIFRDFPVTGQALDGKQPETQALAK